MVSKGTCDFNLNFSRCMISSMIMRADRSLPPPSGFKVNSEECFGETRHIPIERSRSSRIWAGDSEETDRGWTTGFRMVGARLCRSSFELRFISWWAAVSGNEHRGYIVGNGTHLGLLGWWHSEWSCSGWSLYWSRVRFWMLAKVRLIRVENKRYLKY